MFARVQWVLTVAFAVIASSASAQSATAIVQGSTTIVDPVSLTVNQVLTIVAVAPPAIGAPPVNTGGGGGGGGPAPGGAPGANATQSGPVAPIIGNAPSTFAVRDGGGQTLSIAVPQTLELIQVGGGDQVTLTTTTGIVTGSGMDLLGGPLGSEGALSFSVADRAELFNDTELGAYSGLLVLTAQYN